MSDAEKQPVEISPQRVCCPAHGEHMRAQWPKGYLVWGLTIFQAAIASDELIERCGGKRDAQTGQWTDTADVTIVNEITRRTPLCYFVSREKLREALQESGIGSIGQCTICRRRSMGGPYQVSQPQGPVEWWLCFECALDAGERSHAAHPDGGVWAVTL